MQTTFTNRKSLIWQGPVYRTINKIIIMTRSPDSTSIVIHCLLSAKQKIVQISHGKFTSEMTKKSLQCTVWHWLIISELFFVDLRKFWTSPAWQTVGKKVADTLHNRYCNIENGSCQKGRYTDTFVTILKCFHRPLAKQAYFYIILLYGPAQVNNDFHSTQVQALTNLTMDWIYENQVKQDFRNSIKHWLPW